MGNQRRKRQEQDWKSSGGERRRTKTELNPCEAKEKRFKRAVGERRVKITRMKLYETLIWKCSKDKQQQHFKKKL